MCWTSTGASSASSSPFSRLQPLPEKFVMKGVVDRFSEEFVETRMKALDKFLRRVADHPVLSFNPHLNAFLTAKVSPPSPPRSTSAPNLNSQSLLRHFSCPKRAGRRLSCYWTLAGAERASSMGQRLPANTNPNANGIERAKPAKLCRVKLLPLLSQPSRFTEQAQRQAASCPLVASFLNP